MCYFHVKQSDGFPGKVDGSKEHIEDLDVLAYVPSGYTKLWRNLFDLFTDKWQAKGEMKKVWEKLIGLELSYLPVLHKQIIK